MFYGVFFVFTWLTSTGEFSVMRDSRRTAHINVGKIAYVKVMPAAGRDIGVGVKVKSNTLITRFK